MEGSDRFAALKKMMGTRLPPNEVANYEVMISNLASRGVHDLAARKRYRAAVKGLLAEHPSAVPVHNKFANLYNQQFVSEYDKERCQLPVYEGPKAMETTTGKQTNHAATPHPHLDQSTDSDKRSTTTLPDQTFP